MMSGMNRQVFGDYGSIQTSRTWPPRKENSHSRNRYPAGSILGTDNSLSV
jgi:hypothetical protein